MATYDSFSSDLLRAFEKASGPALLSNVSNLKPDPVFFKALQDSYASYSGPMKANVHWQNAENSQLDFNGLSQQEHLGEGFRKMLDPWIGVVAQSPATLEQWVPYKCIIESLLQNNSTELVPKLEDLIRKEKLLLTDLGSVFDCALIAPFIKRLDRPARILEVGGGDGRLALVLSSVPNLVEKYVMIDALPSSIYFSYLFLKELFPDKKVGSPLLGDNFADCDFWVAPGWLLDSVPSDYFDLCLNVESMQEMSQHHVDYYLSAFDNWLKTSGIVYLSNSKDYVFKGVWNLPKCWQLLVDERSPRAWTKIHPTEVFIKKASLETPITRQDLELAFDINLRLAQHKKTILVSFEEALLALKECQLARAAETKSYEERLNSRMVSSDMVSGRLVRDVSRKIWQKFFPR